MITVDLLLINLLSLPDQKLKSLARRDLKVLKSLAKIIASPNFITENQSRLLLKILKENSDKIPEFQETIIEAINTPTWSKIFRPVDRTKKMYISYDSDNNPSIVIEFAYSSNIRKLLSQHSKEISGFMQEASGKIYKADLTEKNIVALVKLLSPLEFDIDEKIENFYTTIKSWSKSEIEGQFFIGNFDHANFQKQITNDLGIDTPIDNNVIADRSKRYQYFSEIDVEEPKNLVEKLAYRKNTKIWINKNDHSLEEIFKSLVVLKRLPVLVIFNQTDHKSCFEDFVILQKSLEKSGIQENIGIYFRLPNDEFGLKFNKAIADHQYNCQLDKNTNVVGVQNGKIPKFFLKNPWVPMSVVFLNTYLKQTKTAVYSSKADLVITYSDQQPMIETRIQWA